ncbi:MAG: hypothetical protein L0Y54_22850 [Sporichthyaceae bacterium]|nr:hypothetical protein [Sporichthyaceae bacterium]
MPTAREISEAAARRTRRALAAAVALLAVTVTATVWLLVAGGPSGTTAPADPASPAPRQPSGVPAGVDATGDPAAIPGQPAAGPAAVPPARSVRLPAPGGLAGELPIQFPHTEEGAAATAVAALAYGWTVDPQVWAAVARTYTMPGQAEQMAVQAELVTALTRQRFGLPQDGPLPAGAYLKVRATGVQWQPSGGDRLRVSVLAEVTARAGQALPERSYLTSITGELVWLERAGDWRMLPSTGALPTPPAVRLGTAEFNTAGWAAIEEQR